jgi:hypothetical protein
MTYIIPACAHCTRFHKDDVEHDTCDAFMSGIPRVILVGDSDHRTSVAGDNGLTFKPVPGFEQLLREEQHDQ